MLIRGGLLIEPWKSYKKYTNNPRNQDVILFENTIYICSVAHISGATFSENADKFISPGASGIGGGSGVSYGGELILILSASFFNSITTINSNQFRGCY